jgi:hypothetical protein
MEFWRYRSRPAAPAAPEVAGPPDSRGAFNMGVKEGRLAERRRHHGHPFITLIVVMVAVAGAAVLALAAHEGSFSRGGAVVDRNIAVAADNAQVDAAKAATQAGQAVKDAGDSVARTVSNAAANRH